MGHPVLQPDREAVQKRIIHVPPSPPRPRTERRRGGGFWESEPVFNFAYRLAAGAVAFLTVVVATVLAGAANGWKMGAWVAVVDAFLAGLILTFGERLRSEAWDRVRRPPDSTDTMTARPYP